MAKQADKKIGGPVPEKTAPIPKEQYLYKETAPSYSLLKGPGSVELHARLASSDFVRAYRVLRVTVKHGVANIMAKIALLPQPEAGKPAEPTRMIRVSYELPPAKRNGPLTPGEEQGRVYILHDGPPEAAIAFFSEVVDEFNRFGRVAGHGGQAEDRQSPPDRTKMLSRGAKLARRAVWCAGEAAELYGKTSVLAALDPDFLENVARLTSVFQFLWQHANLLELLNLLQRTKPEEHITEMTSWFARLLEKQTSSEAAAKVLAAGVRRRLNAGGFLCHDRSLATEPMARVRNATSLVVLEDAWIQLLWPNA